MQNILMYCQKETENMWYILVINSVKGKAIPVTGHGGP
jgi:hypothetical protein